MGQGIVIVSRVSERDIKFRGIEILIDGNFAGNLKFGDSLEIEVDPGSHKLIATNRLKSKCVEFEAKPDETTEFETAGIALGGLWLIMAMLGTVAYKVTLEPTNRATSG